MIMIGVPPPPLPKTSKPEPVEEPNPPKPKESPKKAVPIMVNLFFFCFFASFFFVISTLLMWIMSAGWETTWRTRFAYWGCEKAKG